MLHSQALARRPSAAVARRVRWRRGAREGNPAADRAVRAAGLAGLSEEQPPLVSRRFVAWFCGRLLAAAVLVGAGYVVYDFGSSERFNVRSITISGNVLVSRAEVEHLAAVKGANVFWLNRREVAERLQRELAPVARAEVRPILPDAVEVRLMERRPAAFWVSGGETYLVDSEGIVLSSAAAAVAGAQERPELARACAGAPCDPRYVTAFPLVAQAGGPPLAPGARIDATALAKSAELAQVLPRVGVTPLAFEWTPDYGLEVPTQQGWRVRFGQAGDDLGWQLASLHAIRAYLGAGQRPVELIDVRFRDRPYVR